MFEVTKQVATITSVNLRNELHGDEHVGAVDIGLSMTVPNTVLAMFSPDLVNTFYRGAASGQQNFDGTLTDLRFEMLAMPVKWAYVGTGYSIGICYGMNDDKELNFASCQVDKFKFDMKEGGSVEIAFRVIAHPTAEDVGELYELLGDDVKLTLVPPAPSEEADAPEQSDMLDEPQQEPEQEPDQAVDVDEERAAEILYEQAVNIVRATKAARPDYIRRKMKISVAQANEFIERMEMQGIVTPADHSGQRVVVEDAA